ncbi:NAD-dependent epimerase/dehydratase family protein [Pelomonas aquatica]|jgi:nucleoside-diphosphate-sugar epimerase|uniref:NAD-dependent epimerase/dehydratase family protein n=1 Tax=Pelomonas aquatica TaxID=431058 RepID=A0A9X4LE19_9BURK|nr:NAD-dependent epimerase/dehydratase family protein [Pelomonas aquatica]MCY4754928.1 NAD-dependent epimerase/dehydratase family protein [Pelomonas aquatica]MDG0861054.1 NAD-dependent epimerase/dehydratase family protein [Pelomonas aquatica]
MSTPRILIIGANGQIGTELASELAKLHGNDAVITSDLSPQGRVPTLKHEMLDVTDAGALTTIVKRHKITQIYHLAAALSANGEKHPMWAWDLNMKGLLNVLELARHEKLDKIFWPSSIAAFGPGTPAVDTPQTTVMDPTTVYGISKLAGERWCHWYHAKHGVDVRSLRYPGLISWKTPPGGGTTDYAVEIFHSALQHGRYTCFLEAGQALPMMYMPDALRATIELMNAPADGIKQRGSYNLAGVSFTPEGIAASIRRRLPGFTMDCVPDFRQAIAASWPQRIDDGAAQADWGWRLRYDLDAMVDDMLLNLTRELKLG